MELAWVGPYYDQWEASYTDGKVDMKIMKRLQCYSKLADVYSPPWHSQHKIVRSSFDTSS